MTQPEEGSGEIDQQVLLAVYAALNSRYESNTTLQWQIPAYIFTAQAALVAGLLASKGGTSVGIGWLALTVGVFGPLVMRRIELTARWDRQRLSAYEDEILGPESKWRLLHDDSFPARLRAMPLASVSTLIRRIDLVVAKVLPPAAILMLLMLVLGCASVIIGYLK
jgi:hypothetical protein